MKVGIGITTYNRPDYLKQCLEGVKNVLPVVDSVWVYNDGSKRKEYDEVYKENEEIKVKHAQKNKGVANAKNWLLKQLIKEGCDYLFLLEDDIILKSPKAVTKYIEKSKASGIEHFMFAHHGEANKGKLVYATRGLELYRNPIGAWCMYTKNVIEEVGYFDEVFINAWEHVEHSWRIARAGYTPSWGMSVVDVINSKQYMEEIPGSIDNSSIKKRRDWMANNINGLIYWQDKNPQDFPLGHILESLLAEEAEEYKRLGIENPRQR